MNISKNPDYDYQDSFNIRVKKLKFCKNYKFCKLCTIKYVLNFQVLKLKINHIYDLNISKFKTAIIGIHLRIHFTLIL